MNTFNILKVCVVCAIGISAASCNNSFMDRYPIAEISPENSFKSAQDLELYTNGFYENLPKSMISSEETISRTTYSTAMYLWNNGVRKETFHRKPAVAVGVGVLSGK